MKKIIAVLSFSIFSIFANAQYANTKIQVGQKAPALEFPNPDGTVLKLSDINEKRIVLIAQENELIISEAVGVNEFDNIKCTLYASFVGVFVEE